MNSPKSTINRIWNGNPLSRPKAGKHWSFQKPDGRRRKVETPDVLTIKRRAGGLYQIGQFQPAPLEDVKEYARNKGASSLKMGAITMRL